MHHDAPIQNKTGEGHVNPPDARLVQVVPHPRQLAFQQLEFYAFIHFTVNTFTGREWGEGTESPAIFQPNKLDARQWVAAVKSAGMRGLILTCKHHDGFCLWPSRQTGHTVAASPFRNGKGDVVREVSDACREAGLRFGVYLSPWDRNCSLYGQGKPYDDFFIAQLTELLTGYGDIFSVWFDGACGEGPNGKKQVYDWERYYETIRRLQPEACISVCGPDIRWCGNEAGDTRPSEWSVVPARTRDTERIAENSQQHDDAAFRERTIRAWDQDLGSREILRNEPDLVWYPAEVNTSIRPGWFYHAEEDDRVKSLEALWHVYVNAVGGNATFLLNLPPTPEGLIHETDCRRLAEFGRVLEDAFRTNLAVTARLSAYGANALPGHDAEQVREDSDQAWFQTEDGSTAVSLDFAWEQPVSVRYVVLRENIRLSQRIEAFTIEVLRAGDWQTVHEGTVVGYKRIAVLPDIETDRLRVRITDARVAPTLAFVGVYGPAS